MHDKNTKKQNHAMNDTSTHINEGGGACDSPPPLPSYFGKTVVSTHKGRSSLIVQHAMCYRGSRSNGRTARATEHEPTPETN